MLQTVQKLAPASEYAPAPQKDVHIAISPGAIPYVPLGQLMHALAPVIDEKYPMGHKMQLVDPMSTPY